MTGVNRRGFWAMLFGNLLLFLRIDDTMRSSDLLCLHKLRTQVHYLVPKIRRLSHLFYDLVIMSIYQLKLHGHFHRLYNLSFIVEDIIIEIL